MTWEYHQTWYWRMVEAAAAPPQAEPAEADLNAEIQRAAAALRHKLARVGWDLRRLTKAQHQRHEGRRGKRRARR